MTDWFEETLHDGAAHRLRIDKLIYRGTTEFQDVLIFDNASFGRVLALDGIVQTTTRDEFIYHEMLAHVPIVGHGSVQSVLIIGGGDGGMLEEVLKHPVRKATMVDIDGELVDLARRHLREICGDAFDDARAEVVVGDGVRYVAETDKRFDVIIVDSTDPVGPGEALFSRPFYQGCRRCLEPSGVLVTQNGVPFYQADELRQTTSHWQGLFDQYGAFVAPVPAYVGGFMAFGWAGAGADLSAFDRETLNGRLAGLDLGTRYYSADIHAASFALPASISNLIR